MQTVNAAIWKIHYQLLVVGLILILISNLFDLSLLKIDVDEGLANLGVLFFMMGGIQWLFDATTRKQLFEEISRTTVSNINVATSGIADVINNSKDVDYSDAMKKSTLLIVGFNYSPRVIEDYFDEIKNRCLKKKKTTLVVIDVDSEAGKFLALDREESAHIKPNLCKVSALCSELNQYQIDSVDLFVHDKILHYSFVLSDDFIWVKHYRNSNGISKIPAIKLKSGTPMYEHYKLDIEKFVEKAKKHE